MQTRRGIARTLSTSTEESSVKASRLGEAVVRLERESQVEPDAIASVLRQCSNTKALAEGKRVHAYLSRIGHDQDTFLGNLLVQMYGSCSSVADACTVFQKLRHPNVFSWNLLLGAYAQNGHLHDARDIFDRMPRRDAVSWTSMIAACASEEYLEDAERVFKMMPQRSTISWNSMVAAYAQNGHLPDAKITYDEAPERDIVSWTALITAYARAGEVQVATSIYERLPKRNAVSCTCMITAYAQNGCFELAKRMFEEMPQQTLVSWNAIIQAHAEHGYLEEARKMFDRMPSRDVVSWTNMVTAHIQTGDLDEASSLFARMPNRSVVHWNNMIVAYAQRGHCEEAFALLQGMDVEGVKPVEVTLISVLEASPGVVQGRIIHADIAGSGMLSNTVVATALMNMYAKSGFVEDARGLFDTLWTPDVVSWTTMIVAYAQNGHVEAARGLFEGMPKRDAVSWNAMVAAYAGSGHGNEALGMFGRMQLEGMKADRITFIEILGACVSVAALEQGKSIHACIAECGLDLDVSVGTALVVMYGKCGSVKDASSSFARIAGRNVICWTAMIEACVENGESRHAVHLFRMMDLDGVKPDEVTYTTILDAACATQAAWTADDATHIVVDGGMGSGVLVGNSLVHMYGKCGRLEEARKSFDKIRCRNLVSWNAMLSCYAASGHSKEALEVFQEMNLEGVTPDDVTFMSTLASCSHGGLLEDGVRHFACMSGDYGISASLGHYVCMIDLLGRAGRIKEALELIESMPCEPGVVGWTSFLGACKSHGDAKRGAHAAERIVELDSKGAAPYLLLSDIQASAA